MPTASAFRCGGIGTPLARSGERIPAPAYDSRHFRPPRFVLLFIIVTSWSGQ
jgi:hypothetical protein